MEKEENRYDEEESRLETFANGLVEAMEVNAWTYVSSDTFVD